MRSCRDVLVLSVVGVGVRSCRDVLVLSVVGVGVRSCRDVLVCVALLCMCSIVSYQPLYIL